MTVHKTTRIIIETDRIVTLRKRRSPRAWCPECGREVDMVGLAEGEALTGMTGPVLRAYAEARGWHLAVGPDGDGFICLESWLKSK